MAGDVDCREAFAVVLRTLRRRRGITQADLALRARLHRNYIGRMERAEQDPTLPIVFALASALEIDADKVVLEVQRVLNGDSLRSR